MLGIFFAIRRSTRNLYASDQSALWLKMEGNLSRTHAAPHSDLGDGEFHSLSQGVPLVLQQMQDMPRYVHFSFACLLKA